MKDSPRLHHQRAAGRNIAPSLFWGRVFCTKEANLFVGDKFGLTVQSRTVKPLFLGQYRTKIVRVLCKMQVWRNMEHIR